MTNMRFLFWIFLQLIFTWDEPSELGLLCVSWVLASLENLTIRWSLVILTRWCASTHGSHNISLQSLHLEDADVPSSQLEHSGRSSPVTAWNWVKIHILQSAKFSKAMAQILKIFGFPELNLLRYVSKRLTINDTVNSSIDMTFLYKSIFFIKTDKPIFLVYKKHPSNFFSEKNM